MPPTHLLHTQKPILTTLLLLFLNYDLYRVATNTHPIITPRLERLGLSPRELGSSSSPTSTSTSTSTSASPSPSSTTSTTNATTPRARARPPTTTDEEETRQGEGPGISNTKLPGGAGGFRGPTGQIENEIEKERVNWTWVNGVPIPSFEYLTGFWLGNGRGTGRGT